MKPGRILVRTCTLGASFLVVLGLLEVWLRCFLPIDAQIQELDPVLLARPIPGARSVLIKDSVNGGERISLRINERGFRGPELSERKQDLRVVVFGDSLVMAENVREEDTFVAQLSEELQSDLGREVEVVNAGVTGYGPDQAFLSFEIEAEQLDADLVLLVLCANNDFGDLVRNRLFGLDGSGAIFRRMPGFDPKLKAEFERRRAEARRPAVVRAFRALQRSRAAGGEAVAAGRQLNPFIPLYLQCTRDEWSECVLEGTPLVRNLFRDVYDADVAIQPNSESARYKVSLMRALLALWRDACHLKGVPLLAIVVPSAVDLDPSFQIHVDPTLYSTYDPSRLNRTLAGLLAEAGIAHVDLFGLFRDNPTRPLFEGFIDFHWNRSGQELAAREVAPKLGQFLRQPR